MPAVVGGSADSDGHVSGSRPALSRRDAVLARPVFLVVDDDPTILRAVSQAVEAYGDVYTATAATTARTLIASLDFALALIDVSLPEHAPIVPATDAERFVAEALRSRRLFDPLAPLGIELARSARAKAPSAKIVLFTARSEAELGPEAHELVDVPVAHKPWPIDSALEIAARVAATYEASRVEIETALRELRRTGLPPRALAVLELLALGLPRKTIAEQLGIDPATVNVQVKNIVTAMHASCAGEAVDRIVHRLRVAVGHDEDLRRGQVGRR